eukprot:3669676-Pleurochrysis_carterae.AAC.2
MHEELARFLISDDLGAGRLIAARKLGQDCQWRTAWQAGVVNLKQLKNQARNLPKFSKIRLEKMDGRAVSFTFTLHLQHLPSSRDENALSDPEMKVNAEGG